MKKYMVRVAFNHRDIAETDIIETEDINSQDFKDKLFSFISYMNEGEGYSLINTEDDENNIFAVFEVFEIQDTTMPQNILGDLIKDVKKTEEEALLQAKERLRQQRLRDYEMLKDEFGT